MQRRLLIIWKEPEFDNRGEVVLGQCEPFTSGWKLTLIQPGGNREDLMVGTYTDLRKIQESCYEIDETEKIRKRVQDMRALMLMSVTETVALSFEKRNTPDSKTETKELPSVQDMPKQSPGGFLTLEPSNGVLLATVAQPDRAEDVDYFRRELQVLVDTRSSAVVLDLVSIASLPTNCFKELAGLRDRLKERGAVFGLCNVSANVSEKLDGLRPREIITVYENPSKAISALKS